MSVETPNTMPDHRITLSKKRSRGLRDLYTVALPEIAPKPEAFGACSKYPKIMPAEEINTSTVKIIRIVAIFSMRYLPFLKISIKFFA